MTLIRYAQSVAIAFCLLLLPNGLSIAQEEPQSQAEPTQELTSQVNASAQQILGKEIPDISGYWQTGESKRSVQATISKTESPDIFSVHINMRPDGALFAAARPGGGADRDLPPFTFTSVSQVKWDPVSYRFRSVESSRKVVIIPTEDNDRLNIDSPLDDELLQKASEQERNQLKIFQEWAYNPVWIRSTAIFNGSDRIESKNILVLASKDKISAFNKLGGVWTSINVDVLHSQISSPVVTDAFFSVVIDNRLYGYSAEAEKWDSIPIPAEQKGKAAARLDLTSLTVRLGDKLYALSPRTGKWTTPDEVGPVASDTTTNRSTSKANVAASEQKLVAGLSLPELNDLKNKISTIDERAAQQADRIRRSLKEKGASLDESRSQAETRDVWTELEKTLADEFDAKTKLEQARIQELRRRLDQSEALIEQRQGRKDQIVKRRANELVEGEETQWPTEDVPVAENNSAEANVTKLPLVSAPATTDEQTRDTSGQPLSALTQAEQIKAALGLTLVPLDERDRKRVSTTTKYRDGMKVTQVVKPSPASEVGIVPGDILVGLGDWETTNLDNVTWILNRIQRNASNSETPANEAEFRFFLVRDTTPVSGVIRIAINKLPPAETSVPNDLDRRSTVSKPEPNDDSTWAFLDRIATLGQELPTAKLEYRYTAQLFKRNVVSINEVEPKEVRLNTARRRLENLTEECHSKMASLENDIAAAKADAQTCREAVAHAETMRQNARGTYGQVLEEKRKLAQAEALIPKLEARLKILKRAEEDLNKIKADAERDENK